MFGSPVPSCQISYRPRAPLVTSSNTRAYYLDGDSDIGYLAPDGSTGTAVHLPSNPQVRYAVAVSPDDTRMAVAAFEYLGPGAVANPRVKLSIYVQDIAGGNRVDLFTSTTVSEWPIGWQAGHLVIAVGPGAYVQYEAQNPYFAVEGYHVADARTGTRLATLGGDCLYGPVVRAGTACVFNRTHALGYQSWDAVPHTIDKVNQGFGPGGLSPNGRQMAGSAWHPGGQSTWHLALSSGSGINELDVKGIVQGWLDDEHLFYFTMATNKTFILDVGAGVSAAVPQATNKPLPEFPDPYLHFLGTVPQQVS
jgi:hypothetical protein